VTGSLLHGSSPPGIRQRLPTSLPRFEGKLRKTNNWYIEFVSGNRTIREATEFAKQSDAVEFLEEAHQRSAGRQGR